MLLMAVALHSIPSAVIRGLSPEPLWATEGTTEPVIVGEYRVWIQSEEQAFAANELLLF